MHTTNYQETLITVSPDCPAVSSIAPEKPGSIAALQYALLAGAPYQMTSDDVLFAVHAERKAIPPHARDAEREAFFARPQACLRASPLVKTYGWNLHHDAEGRVALVAQGSQDQTRLAEEPGVAKRPGMRSKRA